jgi:hypothetical protein
MASLRAIVTRDRLALVGDALLLTAAAFCLVTGLTALFVAPTGAPEPGMEWATTIGSLLSMAMVVVIPVLVWLLHGRALSGMAVLGGAVGAFSTGLVFMGVVALSALLGLLASPFTDSEFAGPVAMLILAAAGFVAVVVWLVVDAIRDLAARRRRYPRIDALRLLSAVILVVFAAGMAVLIVSNPGVGEVADAPVFVMVAGLAGALAVAGAETLTGLTSRGTAPPASRVVLP